jgi:hypothetical protein
MNMAAAHGNEDGQTDIDVVDAASHPLAAGFQNETVQVNSNGSIFNYATGLGSGAIPIATIGNNSSQFTIFGYETGSAMTSGTAPARRVGFYMRDDAAVSNMGVNGLLFFDAAINWLAGD